MIQIPSEAVVDPLVWAAGAALLAGLVRRWRGDLSWRTAALYAVASTLFVAPALFTGRSQVAFDYLQQFPPWREASEPPAGPARNPLLTDVALQIAPFRELVRARLLAGELPLWAHELGTGQPLAGNAQSAPFSPLTLLALPLPVERAMTVVAAWQTLLALLGTHLLARSLGARGAGAPFAAVGFAFSLHAVVWLSYPLAATAAWIPAVAAALLDAVAGRPRAVAALTVAAAGLGLSGHPQVALQSAGLVALAAALLAARQPSGERRASALRLARAGLGAALLVGPFAVAVLETALESERLLALSAPESSSPASVPAALLACVAPEANGNPADGNWSGEENYQERATIYAGLLTTALALAGLLLGDRRVRLAIGAAAMPLLISVAPLGSWLPGGWPIALLVDRRIRVLGLLALAVAAGLVLERLRDERRLRVATAALLVPLAVLATLVVPAATSARQDAWRVAVLVAGAAAAVAIVRFRTAWSGAALVVASALELVVHGLGYNPTAPARPHDPPPELRFLAAETRGASEPFRVAAIGGRLLPYAAAAAGLWDPRGWDPMRPAAAAQIARARLHRPANRGQILLRADVAPSDLGFFGVRELLADARWQAPAGWGEVFRGPSGVVWRDPEARSLFFVPESAVAVSGREQARVASSSLADLAHAIVEAPAAAVVAPGARVDAIAARSNGFEVGVETGAPTLVASSVSWMPGWRAAATSGREVEVVRVHGAFVGFVAEPGDGPIALRYEPRGWRVALLALAVGAAGWALAGVRRRGVAALSLLVLAGCGAPKAESISSRLVTDDPYDYFVPEQTFAERTVLTIESPPMVPLSDAEPNPPIAELPVDVDAGAVSRVEVTMREMPRGELHLFWRADGEPFDDERHTFLPGMQVAGDTEKTFRFQVAQVPAWRGRVRELRLVTGGQHRARVQLARVALVGRVEDDAKTRAAVSRAWRVDLGDDLRGAFYLPPRAPREWTVVVPPRGARLRSAVGLLPGARLATWFRLTATRESGDERQLAESRVGPEQAGAWQELAVDLAPFSGETLRLRLESAIEGDGPSGHEYPFWADPVVVAPAPRPARPNVILVSIDTLRADAVSFEEGGASTTPSLAARTRERGVVFRSAIAAAPSTLPSHASMFTGLDAIRHGAVHGAASPELVTLAERLRALGYSTHAQTGGGYLNPRWGLYQGFDSYRYWLDHVDRDQELPKGVASAVDWVESARTAPFFLFLHTYEVHSPYRARRPAYEELHGAAPPFEELIWIEATEPGPDTGFRVPREERYRRRGADPNAAAGEPATSREARAFYDSSVRFADTELERLWRTLDRLGLWQESLVVVTSDHGESFGEHGAAGHGYLSDDNLRVPLILFPPGAARPRRIETQVRLVDLLPTVLELAGGTVTEPIDGVSLVPFLERGVSPGQPREAWSYAGNSNAGVALRVGNRLKWISDNSPWSGPHARRELYRLDTDPAESENRAELDPAASELERTVFDRLRADQEGVRIELRNAGSEWAQVRLSGDAAGAQRVKLLEPGNDGMAWRDGALELAVAPGRRRELLLEDRAASKLRVERLGRVAPGFDVDLARLAGDLVWSCSSSACAAGSGAEALEITVRRGGRLRAPGESPAQPDAELVQQLQALGYVH